MGNWKNINLITIVIGIMFFTAILNIRVDAETSTKDTSQMNIMLERWEKEAPTDVRDKISTLRTGSRTEKFNAIFAIGSMGTKAKGATKALIEALSDRTCVIKGGPPNWNVIGTGDDCDNMISQVYMVALMENKEMPLIYSIYVSREAGAALIKIGKETVTPLIISLKDANQTRRDVAAWALGRLKDDQAIEPLIEALKDEDKEVRQSALASLNLITGQKLGEEPTKWQEWLEKNKYKRMPATGR